MIIFLLRVLYIGSVLIGLAVNIAEYLHARWVVDQLWEKQINGARQMIARMFASEAGMRVAVQFCLLIIAAVGFIVAQQIEIPRHLGGWVFLSLCAHEAVSVMLMVKAIKHRLARRAILHLARSPVAEEALKQAMQAAAPSTKGQAH